MRRRYVKTLAAVVLLAVLWGGFALYSRHKSHEPLKSTTKPAEKLFPLASDAITSFTLERRDAPEVRCERRDGQWAIVQPRPLPADQDAVSSLLSTLTGATADEVIEPHAADLKPFGLAPPAETVEVASDAQPVQFALRLGDDTPTGGGVYAQVEGKPAVFKLAAYVKSSLDKSLFDLRDKRAVTLTTDQIQRIEVSGKDIAYTLVKNPEGVWDLDLPPSVRADRFAADGLVSALHNLSIESIVEENKQRSPAYGLSSPAFTIALTGPGASQILELGEKEKGKASDRYYALNSALDPVFTVDSTFVNQFRKKPSELRSKNLFSFSALEVNRVELVTGKTRRAFELRNDQWMEILPGNKSEDRGKMQDFLYGLEDLQAASFPKGLSVDAARLNQPAYRFTVTFGKNHQEETVEISKVGDHLYARRSTDPLPCELSKDALDHVEKSLNAL